MLIDGTRVTTNLQRTTEDGPTARGVLTLLARPHAVPVLPRTTLQKCHSDPECSEGEEPPHLPAAKADRVLPARATPAQVLPLLTGSDAGAAVVNPPKQTTSTKQSKYR